LWQVCGRSDTTLAQMIRFDLLYVRRRSAWLNIYICWRTLGAVLATRGAF
jgi:lipopolysaccharide/colanic/teichoic acid biosynthesis glycosyltransferase